MKRVFGKLGLIHKNLAALILASRVPIIPIRAITTAEFLEHDPAYEWSPALKTLTMLGNDKVGNCVIVMLLNFLRTCLANCGIDYEPTEQDALDLYSAITGYDPSQTDSQGNNPTDQGTDPVAALDYMEKTGTKEGHKIRAFISIDPHDINHIKAASQKLGGLLGAVQLPSDAQTQFEAGQRWTISSLAALQNPLGGHGIYIPDFDQNGMTADTWAQKQPMSWNWWWGCGIQAFAAVTDQFLKNGVAPNGLDMNALLSYLPQVQG